MLTTVLGVLAGAFYSGAYFASRPYCFYFLAASTFLVAIARSL